MAVKIDKSLDIWVNDKIAYFTMHVRDEIDKYGKDTLFVCDVVDKGEKKLVSSKENRYESRLAVGNTVWIIVWFDMNDKILIKHLGKDQR